MREKNINQNELAELAGLSSPTISRLLADPTKATYANLVTVGEVLGISATNLFSSAHGDNFMELPYDVKFFVRTHDDYVFIMSQIRAYYIKHYGEEYYNKMYRGY